MDSIRITHHVPWPGDDDTPTAPPPSTRLVTVPPMPPLPMWPGDDTTPTAPPPAVRLATVRPPASRTGRYLASMPAPRAARVRP